MAEQPTDADGQACLEAAKEMIEQARRSGGMISAANAAPWSMAIMTTALGMMLAEYYGQRPGTFDRMIATANQQVQSSAHGWLKEVIRG